MEDWRRIGDPKRFDAEAEGFGAIAMVRRRILLLTLDVLMTEPEWNDEVEVEIDPAPIPINKDCCFNH